MCAGALSLVSGAIGAISQFQQGKAQAALHKHQAQVQRRNAKISRDRNARKGNELRWEQVLARGERFAASATAGLAPTGSVALGLRDGDADYEHRIAGLLADAEDERTKHLIDADRSEARARIASAGATAGLIKSAFSLAGRASRSFSSSGTTSLRGFN